MLTRIKETADFLNKKTSDYSPAIGIILGTGLNGLLKDIETDYEILYSDIPGFVEATVEFHPGRLIFGRLSGNKVICMSGRFHYYEGYSMEQVTFPVRVMKLLGIEYLFISNAAGGMNPEYREKDLMLISDHISLFLPESPLRGECILGDRFPDMSEPYDTTLLNLAMHIVAENKIDRVQKGVYVSVPGPHLESKAEYRLLRMAGADAVGMSTVPEVLVAVQMNIKILGLSVITDMGIPETLQKADINKILAAASAAEPKMTTLFKEIILKL
jgi:purine-nucleoside phosphorylase